MTTTDAGKQTDATLASPDTFNVWLCVCVCVCVCVWEHADLCVGFVFLSCCLVCVCVCLRRPLMNTYTSLPQTVNLSPSPLSLCHILSLHSLSLSLSLTRLLSWFPHSLVHCLSSLSLLSLFSSSSGLFVSGRPLSSSPCH